MAQPPRTSCTSEPQAHGPRSSRQTLDNYYANLYLLLDWGFILTSGPLRQGTVFSSEANSLAAGFQVPLSDALEATAEALRVAGEAQESQLPELRVGILRQPPGRPILPTVQGPYSV